MTKIMPHGHFSFRCMLQVKNCGVILMDPLPNQVMPQLAQWVVKEAQIMSWLLGSVEPHFILNLRPYKTAKEMWACLLQIYQ